jgi:hypothetical protein
MVDIESFVKTDKDHEVMEEINKNPALYTRIFTRIFSKLCRSCRRKLTYNFRKGKQMSWDDYCPQCKEMAEEEYNCLK